MSAYGVWTTNDAPAKFSGECQTRSAADVMRLEAEKEKAESSETREKVPRISQCLYLCAPGRCDILGATHAQADEIVKYNACENMALKSILSREHRYTAACSGTRSCRTFSSFQTSRDLRLDIVRAGVHASCSRPVIDTRKLFSSLQRFHHVDI
ncbi:hypothetical protein KL921_004887 [Ogataea angusta]|uniref:Uncharacterized protein n=1 Tax=Pichia angusta TaxID=870730 RepID=A0AAN6I2Z9_PICAN|nr:uncharacterized protein KL928_005171 [Ogataea angusta]KAG7806490.1 hypothetical protein KL921_004887 [Ogataea angusta]KAG7815832.1 hypothetical protein KL928_005171 [Ogataea angusta]KAG7826959.1 hypothetical protein KL920_004957 [Ogataea angusta]KAG7854709.1 hypothetical protein KL919_004991 [Ogataea angusta]